MENLGLIPGSVFGPKSGNSYWQRQLGLFYSEPSNRLLCYLIMAGSYIFCTYLSIMVVHGPKWLAAHLEFASAYGIHAAALYAGCYAIVDFLADRLGTEAYKFKQRTVASQWMVMFLGFVVAYTLHRGTYLLAIGLYAPWVVERIQIDPDLRRPLVLEFLYFTAWWAPKVVVIVQLALCVQKVKKPAAKEKQSRQEAKTVSDQPTGAPVLVHQAGSESLKIDHARISHISVEDHYCRIHHQTGGGVSNHLLRLTMKQLLKELSGDVFFQIHRSHLVNLNHARGWKKIKHKHFLVMNQGAELPISRGRMAELKPDLQRLNIPRLN